jgi:NADP-dependent 3-hydroxy acid dehydrogenase YdfG
MNTKIRPAIADKVAIFTGASSGMGEVTRLEFAFAGVKEVLAARRIHRPDKLAEIIRCRSISQYPN